MHIFWVNVILQIENFISEMQQHEIQQFVEMIKCVLNDQYYGNMFRFTMI